MGRAFSEIISGELAASPGLFAISSTQMHSLERQTGVRPISAPGISSERTLALLSGATEVGYGDFYIGGGRLRATLTLRDPATGHTIKVLRAESAAGDISGAASSLAHQISPNAGKYATANSLAIEAYMSGMEQPDPAASGEAAARAIAADPNFGPAYRMLASAKARLQDREGALAALAEGAARGDAIPPPERARIALEAAGLENNMDARLHALAALVKEVPGDLEALRALAELAYGTRDYPQAVSSLQKLLAVQPDNPDDLNQLGYAYAYSGKQAEALAALRRYQALRPNDLNALDSMGDVYLVSGNPQEAARLYLEVAQKDPHFQGGGDLFKASMARLMSGDLAGADALQKQSDTERAAAHDPAVPYHQAEWAWLSGRRKQAYQQLLEFARQSESGPLKELAANAYSELALWSLMLGDRAGAGEMVHQAVQFAGPKSAATVALVRFLALPAAPAEEWVARVGQLFHNAGAAPLQELWLAYAFLLNKNFAEAGALLAKSAASGLNTDDSLPILQAWALVETGKVSEAAPLLRLNPAPSMTGPALVTSLYFPRLYYLRGVVAEKQGKREEARADYQMFLQLSGPTPLQWGEEERAQKALR
jgi:tetratricopeptide (TPR) repeat protein